MRYELFDAPLQDSDVEEVILIFSEQVSVVEVLGVSEMESELSNRLQVNIRLIREALELLTEEALSAPWYFLVELIDKVSFSAHSNEGEFRKILTLTYLYISKSPAIYLLEVRI